MHNHTHEWTLVCRPVGRWHVTVHGFGRLLFCSRKECRMIEEVSRPLHVQVAVVNLDGGDYENAETAPLAQLQPGFGAAGREAQLESGASQRGWRELAAERT